MEELLDVIRKRNIILRYENLHRFGSGLDGLYVLDPLIGHLIILDNTLLFRYRQHRCVLAEEIGHSFYPPRPSHIRFHKNRCKACDNDAVIMEQDEQKALKWATDFLIPDAKLWQAMFEGYRTVSELTDYFDVEDWFLRKKIGFIRRKARNEGIKLKWGDIFLRR